MEGSVTVLDAKLNGIKFCFASKEEICKASISECPISHASQISNPFLGLPLDTGKCESCGTGEPGQCEGHFGYVELPTPIYHPDHVSELRKILGLVCLKCLKLKSRKVKNIGIAEQVLSSCCTETMQVTINEAKTADGVCYLELKVPARSKREEPWSFLEKYGFRFRHMNKRSRPLLPAEVMEMLKRMPQDTRKKLCAKGFFLQEGYIIQYLPVPPNCLSVPDVSDGISTMSTDHSIALLKKVLRQAEIIKSSRSGKANFESHEIEANDLQAAVAHYLRFWGTNKVNFVFLSCLLGNLESQTSLPLSRYLRYKIKKSQDVDTRFGFSKEVNR